MDTKFAKRVCQIASPLDDNGESEIYFIGIIDCFTLYNWKKVVANNVKKTKWANVCYISSLLLKVLQEELSTVNAQFYSERFIEFFNQIFVDGK
jgi:hypothetical protein